jgi:hypothetical protein
VNPLVAILDTALEKWEPELGFPKVVTMTGVEQMHDPKSGPLTPQEKANIADNLVREAHQYLSALLPLCLEIELVCLSETNGPDLLHNRFLITDIAGVVMPYGVDARENAAIDDIQPMHRGIYEARWQQYARRRGITVVRSGDIIRSTRTR